MILHGLIKNKKIIINNIMCGITAIYGYNIINKLLKSLKELQNRGYDSVGISYINENNELITVKYASTKDESAISKLEKTKFGSSNIGIAHTRWATHGKKSDINSHPHVSNNNKFSFFYN
jgi:glucosamine--fructose-6-phosphate aminotransferase (isomerizing)